MTLPVVQQRAAETGVFEQFCHCESKILNVERQKHNAAKVFQNQEIQTMIRALGAGVGNNSEDEAVLILKNYATTKSSS